MTSTSCLPHPYTCAPFLRRSMPMQVWYDGPEQKLRVDMYDGLDLTYLTPVSCCRSVTRAFGLEAPVCDRKIIIEPVQT